ncbi:MAG: dicarboxylate/amino acid:cation symporter [Armatimonadota bacterium]
MTEASGAPDPPRPHGRRLPPLWTQVLAAAVAGALLGSLLGKEGPFGPDPTRAELLKSLGAVGILVIKALRALAVPLVFVAILDAFAKTRIPARRFGRLAAVCLLNVSVAMAIGLTLLNTVRPGETWRGRLEPMIAATGAKGPEVRKSDDPEAPGATLDLLANVSYQIPSSLVRPFVYNNLISVVLVALLAGAALRRVRDRNLADTSALESLVESLVHVLQQMLEMVVHVVPIAVFLVVAKVVGESGLRIFSLLWVFLATALAGLLLHALLWYPVVVWWRGRRSPRTFLRLGADAILTGLSTNSSLATVPVTLRCLERMGVSPASSRLAACVGTNLNNDGITLYEAMAALFLTQALGIPLGLGQQLTVVVASVVAGAGIAGIPEAGLIVLPLVLGAAGLSPEAVAVALPLLLPVDWIIARVRSGVNVMSDMVVAIALDGPPGARKPDEAEVEAGA